jgi:hypothetical protein
MMPKLYIDGTLISEIDEGSAAMLIALAQQSTMALNVATAVIPIRRGDSTRETLPVERGSWETPVERRRADLTLEFIRRGEPELILER